MRRRPNKLCIEWCWRLVRRCGIVLRSNQNARRKRHNPWSITGLEPRTLLAGDVAVAADFATASTNELHAPTTPADDALHGDAALRISHVDSIVFVDSRVDQMETLHAGLTQGAEWVLIDQDSDAIEQITRHLETRRGVSAIHLVSHGQSGQLQMGNQPIDEQCVLEASLELKKWSASLTPGADILVYGCDVGSGEVGARFAKQLARVTGVDVAISTDRTGTASGADWDLEMHVGSIQAPLAFSHAAQSSYTKTMAVSAALPLDPTLDKQSLVAAPPELDEPVENEPFENEPVEISTTAMQNVAPLDSTPATSHLADALVSSPQTDQSVTPTTPPPGLGPATFGDEPAQPAINTAATSTFTQPAQPDAAQSTVVNVARPRTVTIRDSLPPAISESIRTRSHVSTLSSSESTGRSDSLTTSGNRITLAVRARSTVADAIPSAASRVRMADGPGSSNRERASAVTIKTASASESARTLALESSAKSRPEKTRLQKLKPTAATDRLDTSLPQSNRRSSTTDVASESATPELTPIDQHNGFAALEISANDASAPTRTPNANAKAWASEFLRQESQFYSTEMSAPSSATDVFNGHSPLDSTAQNGTTTATNLTVFPVGDLDTPSSDVTDSSRNTIQETADASTSILPAANSNMLVASLSVETVGVEQASEGSTAANAADQWLVENTAASSGRWLGALAQPQQLIWHSDSIPANGGSIGYLNPISAYTDQ